MKEAILVLIGLITGAILSWFQFRYIWINQKRLEAKLTILDEAAEALGLYQREALDPKIQSKKRKYETQNGSDLNRSIELTADTAVLIKKTLVKTKALFSEQTYNALNKALSAPLSVKEPNGDSHHDFISNSDTAIKMMGDELKANEVRWLASLIKKLKSFFN
jgi:hypothetical protein